MNPVPTSTPARLPFDGSQVREWDLRDPISQIQFMRFDEDIVSGRLVRALQQRLGRQTRCLTHEGRRWWAWEDPAYVLYAHPSGVVALDVPEGQTHRGASEAVLWDAGVLDKALTRAEHKEWVEVGRKAAQPHVVEFPSLDKAALKRFVLDYCDGSIYCDHQCNPNDMNMVFMPLALGAFHVPGPKEGEDGEPDEEPSAVWLAMQSLPDAGPRPQKPDAPPTPDKPEYPDPPPKPVLVEPDPERVALLQADPEPETVRSVADIFGEVPDDTVLAEYQAEIDEQNEQIQAEHRLKLDEWQAAKADIDREHDNALAAHAQDVAEYDEACKGLQAAQAAWDREKAIADATHIGFGTTRLQNLGVIYERMSKAGPRSINGQPIFFSFSILNRSDWVRAHAAIVRELKRREDMEI